MNNRVLAAVATVCVAGGAQAGDWTYTVAPYFWGPEVRTSLDVGPNPPVNGNTSIFDILKGAFLIAGEARNGRWSIGGEFNYLNLGDDVSIGRFDDAASWKLEGTMSTLGASYAVYEDDQSRLDVMAGLRHWDLDVSTTVRNRTVSTDQSWTDPLIGARYSHALNERWSVTGLGNVGGFGYGSKFQWEALVQASWKWTDRINVSGGYRHLDVEFEEGREVIDLILTGPYVALAFSF
ncbi:hypothetical protein SAMN05444358_1011171 [Ruegeria halocynthiae]|uniref:Outer membrane protein beta-barrel domain-containing protein n=1 Tax=Ruegeria halocynthiae TaxID=985054 RepID=A0A1H2UKV8_9RHOB|nr:hypothetical protein [Ruegeria halocynthiae]SDW56793.1 hypothetical protein SAMN05444358_1011171 [Ruegeria halocynthiae]